MVKEEERKYKELEAPLWLMSTLGSASIISWPVSVEEAVAPGMWVFLHVILAPLPNIIMKMANTPFFWKGRPTM